MRRHRGPPAHVPPPLTTAERARRIATFRQQATEPLGRAARQAWTAPSLAGFRRALLADVAVGVSAFAGIAWTSGAIGGDLGLGATLALAGALGAAAALGLRRMGGGPTAGAACFGAGMIAFAVWRILAVSLVVGEHDLAQSLGAPLALRIGGAMVLGAAWGHARGVRRDRRGAPGR